MTTEITPAADTARNTLQLHYAPPIAAKGRLWVIPAGLATTGLAVAAVWALDRNADGVNVMGWYLNYVIPIGAILVGVVAGSGYGLASWLSGTRVKNGMLALIAAFQLLAYWSATYLAFAVATQGLVSRQTGKPIGFFQYYDLTTTSLHFTSSGPGNDKPGEALGNLGYGLRALEMLGFMAGGVLLPLALKAQPYCELCSIYMTTKKFPTLAASAKHRKVGKKDVQGQAALAEAHRAAGQEGADTLENMRISAANNDLETFRLIVDSTKGTSRAAKKLARRIEPRLQYCKNCHCGQLVADVLSGQGKKIKRANVFKAPVPEEFVTGLIGATKPA